MLMEDAFQHLVRLASTLISGGSKARMISRAFSISFLVYVWIIGWCGAPTLLMYMMVFILNFPLSSTARRSIRNMYCLLSNAAFDCVWPWKATLTYIRKEDEEEMNGLF